MSEQYDQGEQLSMDDIWGMIGTAPEDLKKEEKPKPAKRPKAEKKDQPKAEKKETEETKSNGSWTYPFQIYFAGKIHDTTGMFESEKVYTAKQITDIMLQNHFYEFSGTVEYDYIEDTNTLVAMFRQHKKG